MTWLEGSTLPLLADKGLGAALEAQVRKVPVPVEVVAVGVDRFDQEVEAAVYFSCLEALQNVAKYTGATQATVELRSDPSVLRFAVRDDGRGFDPSAASGSGLQGVRDRLDAIGGSLEIQSSPGAGTTIAGSVPLVVDLLQPRRRPRPWRT